jgi:hypothetical protein
MEKCPLCGSRAFYAGLFMAKCGGRGCQNYEAPVQEEKELEYGTWAWGCRAQRLGYRLEWRRANTTEPWDDLDEQLENDESPNNDYAYRIQQSFYHVPSGYIRGTDRWARDQERAGWQTYYNGSEYEIRPAKL